MSFKKILKRYINQFDPKNKNSETHDVTIDDQKYFIKVVGKTKKEHMKNEVNTLHELASIFSMYEGYFIDFLETDNNCAIILKYIEGEDLKSLLSKEFDEKMVLCLYKMLFMKITEFHKNNITHGDVKPQNFYSYIDMSDMMAKIKLIDTETCTVHDKIKDISEIKRLRSLYYYLPDNPKSSIFYKNKEQAFTFFKYLDHYSLACFMLYLYDKKLYQMLKENDYKEEEKNPWRFGKNDLRSPYDYVDKNKNKLERILHYVFKYIPTDTYQTDLPKFSQNKLHDMLFD